MTERANTSSKLPPDIKPCPYWQQYLVSGEYVLALCGALYEEYPFGETDIGTVLPSCPLFFNNAGKEAFERPVILETTLQGLRLTRFRRDRAYSDKSGGAGICELVDKWDEEVVKFYQRHPV